MIFKFNEGERVALKMDHGDLLPAGSEGTIFCMYRTTPPAYEVVLWTTEGKEYGAIMEESNLAAVTQKAEATSSAPAASVV